MAISGDAGLTSMPNEPIPPTDPTSSSPEPEEWTDDVAPVPSEQLSPAVPDPEVANDDWNGPLDWEDDPVEPSPSPPPPPSTQDALAWLQPLIRRGWGYWQQILAGLRSRLPATARWSDSLLSGLLLGTLALLVMGLIALRQPAGGAAEPMAPSPPSPPAAAEAAGAAEEVNAAVIDGDRIAAIQAQLTDSAVTSAGVVESVQADFQHNRLTVDLSSGWYRLSPHEQDELANALQQRSLEMTFDETIVRSPDGDVVARSPVVGDEMVILQRHPLPEVPTPPRPRYRLTIDP